MFYIKRTDIKSKVFDTIGNIFTAGGSSRKKTEEDHEHLADIAEYYDSRYIIIEMQAKKESSQYHWLRKKAKMKSGNLTLDDIDFEKRQS